MSSEGFGLPPLEAKPSKTSPLSFLWKRLKALLHKIVERVRHNAGILGFQWKREPRLEGFGLPMLEDLGEDEEAFLFLLLAEELFD